MITFLEDYVNLGAMEMETSLKLSQTDWIPEQKKIPNVISWGGFAIVHGMSLV